MPELPEVEVSRQGIAPHIEQQLITQVTVWQPRLRWPISTDVMQLEGEVVRQVKRRAKYLLLETRLGTLIIHLGMSGKLHVVPTESVKQKHDHFALDLATGMSLRLNDARRFGAVLWQTPGEVHQVLAKLGPEPLTDDFSGLRLYELSRGKTAAVKAFIMDNAVVVGVGNIYANEALFATGIDPRRAAGNISKARYIALGEAIKVILAKAIAQGGTTLKDFLSADGKPGYFKQELQVYGRAGEPCPQCLQPIRSLRIGQRNSFFCARCQK